MKRFLLNVLAFAALVMVLDLPFRWAMHELPKREYDDRLLRVLNDSMRYDVLVFGSSRAARDVLPQVITERTGISAFNLGYPGASIEFQEFILRMVLRNPHRPRTVLLIVDDPSELVQTRAIDFRLDRTYPLAAFAPVNDEICARTGKSWLLTRLLASYRIKDRLSNLWDPPHAEKLDTIFADGSMPTALRSPTMDTAIYRLGSQRYAIAKESSGPRRTFDRFVQQCADAGIHLVIVHPPDLRSPNERFVARMRELVADRALIYRYDTLNAAYKDRRNYYDAVHLNRTGASIFSAELADMLKPVR